MLRNLQCNKCNTEITSKVLGKFLFRRKFSIHVFLNRNVSIVDPHTCVTCFVNSPCRFHKLLIGLILCRSSANLGHSFHQQNMLHQQLQHSKSSGDILRQIQQMQKQQHQHQQNHFPHPPQMMQHQVPQPITIPPSGIPLLQSASSGNILHVSPISDLAQDILVQILNSRITGYIFNHQ